MIESTATVTKISVTKTALFIPLITTLEVFCEYLQLKPILVLILIIMMFIDFVSAGFKQNSLGNKFELRTFILGIYSKIMTFLFLFGIGLLIASANEVAPNLFESFNLGYYINGVALMLITIEFISIMDNMIGARESNEPNEFDLFTWMLKFLRHKLIDKIVKIIARR